MKRYSCLLKYKDFEPIDIARAFTNCNVQEGELFYYTKRKLNRELDWINIAKTIDNYRRSDGQYCFENQFCTREQIEDILIERYFALDCFVETPEVVTLPLIMTKTKEI